MLDNARVRAGMSKVLDPCARGLLKLGVTPSVITVVGTIGVTVTALVCYPQGWFFWGTVIITVFVISDLLDGAVARLSQTTGKFGALLDSVCDRVADGAIFGGVLLYVAGTGQMWLAGATLVALVGGQVVSYVKARGQGLGLDITTGLAERAERLLLSLVAIGLTGLGVPYILAIVMWLLAALTVITAIQRVWQALALVRAEDSPH